MSLERPRKGKPQKKVENILPEGEAETLPQEGQVWATQIVLTEEGLKLARDSVTLNTPLPPTSNRAAIEEAQREMWGDGSEDEYE